MPSCNRCMYISRVDHSKLVADYYLKARWNETTKEVIVLVPNLDDIFVPPDMCEIMCEIKILPPMTKDIQNVHQRNIKFMLGGIW